MVLNKVLAVGDGPLVIAILGEVPAGTGVNVQLASYGILHIMLSQVTNRRQQHLFPISRR